MKTQLSSARTQKWTEPAAPLNKTYRALVVEDDPETIDQVVDVLNSLEHEYDTACSQREAADRMKGQEYSYVLPDIEIPAVSRKGRPRIQNVENLLEKIHRMKGLTPPVVIMSDYAAEGLDATENFMRLAMSLKQKGAADLIKKPFPTAGRTLDRVIKKVLRLPMVEAVPKEEPGEGQEDVQEGDPEMLTVTAAGREEFETNGLKGRGRRIDRHTFSTWRLKQRDRDLDAEDDDS
jgi:CheY-like chemotaxis protein